jgi:hypothetical protein
MTVSFPPLRAQPSISMQNGLGAKHMVTSHDHLSFLAGVASFLYRLAVRPPDVPATIRRTPCAVGSMLV